ncbi:MULTISPECIES: adenylate/guanylate cyclase domain-containing protein [Pseudovibrio]|uniref:adenylate/guanylate cyclase domain-containing protein n=1 Tax=Stappiaceae TaxID=2821832 RepID=UPI002365156E|nr:MULTISPECIES: adenylate/guanylate cyclase domain-containing protein [Pseudovibrio]MDD7911487.1 adenylate/guanylate cyclase domain-containing protein [Pseudovibrio exalbescens]MDX5594252.1 adenylate/guanylate cyclase domain-containing protein [Pseudovibrio sp. SPO723]
MHDVSKVNAWLINEGRTKGDLEWLVRGYCEALVDLGVPLNRVRVGQHLASPLLSAWGVIWTLEAGTAAYEVPVGALDSVAWKGSPFEYIVQERKLLRVPIHELDLDQTHSVYREQAEAGATDFLAMPLEYGDGTVQASSFTTRREGGFTAGDLAALGATRHALAAAAEPMAMRRSMNSLLCTYLGNGPASEVINGVIRRGEYNRISAAILFADLRGFTAKSESWGEQELLQALCDYFDVVVSAVLHHGGDVLKFIGDGVVAIFPEGASRGAAEVCKQAVAAALEAHNELISCNKRRLDDGKPEIQFVTGINHGSVTYGNIGGPDRLDFTVVGPAVNVASRVQELCKSVGAEALMTAAVAQAAKVDARSEGLHSIQGLAEKVELYRLR